MNDGAVLQTNGRTDSGERAVSAEGRPEIVATVFGPAPRPLFGFFHQPHLVNGTSRALGVVLCNPLGFEAMCMHRTYRRLADRLAQNGFPALRFDYESTGDSSGRLDEPGRVRAWIDSVKAAAAQIRAQSGAVRVGLFGARLGVALAATAASEGADIDCLIAWAPVVSGRAYALELRAFRMMSLPKEPARADRAEEVGGFLYSRETLEGIARLDLTALRDKPAKTAMVIPGDAPKDGARLTALWTGQGVDVRVAPVTRYADMLRDPYDTVVPESMLDGVVEWLSAGCPDRQPAASTGYASSVMAVTGDDGSRPFTETALSFGEQGRRLFGILTQPQSSPPGHRPTVCLLNVGANHHVGPHRIWVVLARELASLGYQSLRFDISGLGESRPAPGERENRIYSRAFVDDVKSAMTAVSEKQGVDRFVLVGLCSGAYLAFRGAIEDPRVVGQVLLNTHTFDWKEGDPVKPTFSRRYYTRALADRQVWLRALKREVHVRYIAGVLLKGLKAEAASRLQSMSAVLRRRRDGLTVKRGFEATSERGVQSLLVFSTIDGGVDMLANHLGPGARMMRKYPNFEIEVLDDIDHVFTRVSSQRKLSEILRHYLTAHFP